MGLIILFILLVADIGLAKSVFEVETNKIQLSRIRRNLDKVLQEPEINNNISMNFYSLLVEIKGLLSDKISFENRWQAEFDALNDKVQSSINNIESQIDNLSKSSIQKVDILQQAFSGLAVHLTSDSKTLDDTRTRVTLTEHRIHKLEKETKINTAEQTKDLEIEKEDITSDMSVPPVNSHLIVDTLSASVPESPLIKSWKSDSEKSLEDEKSEATNEDANDVLSLGVILNNLVTEINKLNIETTNHSLLISETRNQNEELGHQISNFNETFSCSCAEDLKTQITNLERDLDDLQKRYETLWISSNDSFVDSAKILAQMKVKNAFLENKMLSLEAMITGLVTSTSEISKDKNDIDNLRAKMEIMERSLNVSLEIASNNIEQREIVVSSVKPGLCVWPYIRRAGSCFFISKDKRLKWDEARKFCEAMQGDLAAPKNFEIFRQFLSDQKLSRSYTYWIGGTDKDTEDDWRWIDGTKIPMGSKLWATDQPNEGKSSNCMGIRLSSRVIATSDDDCSLSNYFICEQEHN